MTEDEVADHLWQWLTDMTGATVIHAHQGKAEPLEPFLVIQLLQSNALYQNRADTDYPSIGAGADEVISEAPVRDWFWRFSLNAYGAGGDEILRKVKAASVILTHSRKIAPLNIFETTRIASIPELLNEDWRRRVQMDIELRGLVRDAMPIDVAEKASVVATPVT